MDRLGLVTLKDELLQDCVVAEKAVCLAELRFQEGTDSGTEGCAHHLVRFYNVVEQMALRIAKAFENHIDDERGWHTELIRRLSIAIEGVRPAFFLTTMGQPLRELRSFRHVINHAYDLELDRDKLVLLLKYARQVAPGLKSLVQSFVDEVSVREGWPL